MVAKRSSQQALKTGLPIINARTSSSQPSKPAEPQSDPSAPPMLRYQPFLPSLPVPPLSQTLALYLTTIKPHLSSEEYSRSEGIVRKFEGSEQGKELQKRLEGRAAEGGRESWLSEWFNEASYMGYRDPIVPWVNYFYIHKDQANAPKSQTRRAAELVIAIEAFRKMVDENTLEPERVRVTPLDMGSYVNMFNTSRIPAIPSDTYTRYPSSNGQNDHVIVMRNGRYFKVKVGGLGAEEVDRAFKAVIDLAGQEEGPDVGLLTVMHRDVWTKARDHLISISQTNAETLKAIESSILVVSLDDSDPVGTTTNASDGSRQLEERSWRLWAGGAQPGDENGGSAKPTTKVGKNRWFDKHDLIVFPSSSSGFNGEHSLLDGTPTLRMNEFILSALAKDKIDLEPSSSQGKRSAEPVELKWELDDKAKKDVEEARKVHGETMGNHKLEVLHYTGYGKNLIKTHKCSPDAWAQLVKHLAFYKLENRMPAVYESCQTRKFKLGRTEVIRSASQESKEWIESMLDPKATDAHRVTLFRAAVSRHLKYAALASDGLGVDRHFFGLKKVLKEGETMPEVFTEPAFAKASKWELSTSQLGSDYLDGWGYGEVVPDGYGLSYSVGDDFLRWVITCQKPQKAEQLKENLRWACEEVKAMFERGEQPKAKL